MPPPNITLGSRAEALARRYLESRKFCILGQNWRRPWGELDIIAEREGTLHFVEVKAERLRAEGFEAYRRAGGKKLLKVIRTARTWLASHERHARSPWQVDVLSVTVDEPGRRAHITHFKNVTA